MFAKLLTATWQECGKAIEWSCMTTLRRLEDRQIQPRQRLHPRQIYVAKKIGCIFATCGVSQNTWRLQKRGSWPVENVKWIAEMVRRVQSAITLSVDLSWILHRVKLRHGDLHIGMKKKVRDLQMRLQNIRK